MSDMCLVVLLRISWLRMFSRQSHSDEGLMTSGACSPAASGLDRSAMGQI